MSIQRFQKSVLIIFIVFAISTFASGQKEIVNVNFGNYSFDKNWFFSKGSQQGAEQADYNDSGWRSLNLPHDWSIEDLPDQSDSNVIGPFSKASPGATSTGYTIGGEGWYRKKFKLSPKDKNKSVSIIFDGVYMNCDVWINGHHLGNHPYGYTAFAYDLTNHLNRNGKANTIAVRVCNEGKNSRWYTGSGIYRHVSLIIKNPLHVNQWGVYITTPVVTKAKAAVKVITTINNNENKKTVFRLRTNLIDTKGKIAGSIQTYNRINSNSSIAVTQTITVTNPQLWSTEMPALYKAETIILKEDVPADSTITHFGIRAIQFDAVNGFRLNGKKVLLRGGCVHHDNGPLGSAAIDRAEERKVELLKSFGYNAVRTSHNPPSKSFLDACDRLGLFVIDEAFDMWEVAKNPKDYHLYFRDWWRRDIQSMVLRDRNHPSVILWSIGNEINERADANGLEIAKQLKDEVKSLDTTRPVTEAICDFWEHGPRPWDESAPAFALLDIGGYNYEWKRYETDHQKYPGQMLGTESFAKEAFENWQAVENYPWLIGDFVWTAMDYMGETAIGHAVLDNEKDGPALEWPWFNAYCGDIDLIGEKKPQSFYRDVVWKRSKITMAVHAPVPEGRTEKVSKWGWPDERQSWTWPGREGKPLQVSVYSGCAVVKLELNGKIIGEKRVSEKTKLTATFEVPYSPGTLKAIGLENEKEVSSVTLTTAGPPAKIRLSADRSAINSDINDLSYVTAHITDDKGNLVPDAEIPVNFSITGEGALAGIGNGNPKDMRSFQQPVCKTFRGKCLVIIKPTGKKGAIKLKAESNGLSGNEIIVHTN